MSSTSTADAIVIGGGITGLFTALALAEQGLERVVLLEKRRIGAGSSGKSGAILRQHYSHETTVRMARESLMVFRSLEERSGRDVGFRETGMAFICPASDRDAVAANVELQQGIGVAVEMLDASGLRDLAPGALIGDDVVGAYEREAGYVDPGRTLAAVAVLAARAGVQVREGTRVVEVGLDGGADGSRVTGVTTDAGETISSPVVVNAGGPWAGIICRRLGVDLPLTAVRPEQAFFMPPEAGAGGGLIVCDLLTGVYWKPEPAGWTRVGHMSYDDDEKITDPDSYDEGVSHRFIDDCRRRMAERIPAYRDAISWGGCSALYTITPDAHALIGAVPGIGGLYLASGFSGHGFKMGPAVGRGLAGLVTGARGGHEGGAFDPAFFAVDRFEAGREQSTSYRFGILG